MMQTERRRSLGPGQKATVIKRQNGECACGCGEPLEIGSIDFDHAVALQFGGTNDIDNFQALKKRHHLDKSKDETKRRAKADRIAAREGLMKKRISQKDKQIARMAGLDIE